MFVISQLLSAITQPLFWLAMWWLLGLLCLTRRPRTARRMLWSGLLVLGLLGFQAVPDALLRPLENRYAIPTQEQLQGHAGVIVLGGALEHPASWQAHGQVPLGQSAERMTVPVGLMQQWPQWQLVFSGGEGRLLATGISEGQLAQQFYQELGVDMARVMIEPGSRTTRENAQQVAHTLGARCGQERWVLVTSAWHMPRSVPEFEAVGCRVTPYPVDFRSGHSNDWSQYRMAKSLIHWQVALREWLGQVAYTVTR